MKRHCIDETCAICTLDRIHAHLKGVRSRPAVDVLLVANPIMELIHDYRTGMRSTYKNVDDAVEFNED